MFLFRLIYSSKKLHNEGIRGKLDAWLTFLGCDEPEYIVKLVEEYPYFKQLYADLYTMCQNVEKVMSMFSKELQVLDRNTVKYMIDELQEELDDTKEQLVNTKEELEHAKDKLSQKDDLIARLKAEVEELKSK